MPGFFGPAGMRGQSRRVSRRTSRRMGRRADKRQDDGQNQSNDSQQPANVGATSSADATDELKKLGELHDSGVLTDEEFNQKKAEILKRL